MAFPNRFIGYGAYNLCFDKFLGKPEPARPAAPDYFGHIRHRDCPDINLVKVILFRNSRIEGLPLARSISLYYKNPNNANAIEVNPAFLDNLVKLVDRAAQTKFTVQICIFHYHALAIGLNEYPEILPAVLDPRTVGTDLCSRTVNFFSTANAARLKAQKNLVKTVATKLAQKSNVIWELCNEIRAQCIDQPDTLNCGIVPWLREMRTELRSAIPNAYITTSVAKSVANTGTGIRNEEIIFGRTGRTCANPPLDVDYYDLHYGQWFEYPDLDGDGWTWPEGILDGKARCGNYGPFSLRHIIINDDGAHDDKTVDDVKKWSGEAFFRWLSYSSKQPYEPGRRFDDAMLDALQYMSTQHTSGT